MITSRGTPFSLATASMTSNSSLLIFVSSVRASPPSVLVRFVLAALAAARARPQRLLRGRDQAQRDQVGDQARLLDVFHGDGDLVALAQRQRHRAVAGARDRALQAPAAVLRQAQRDLRLLAREAREVRQREQRPVDAR